MDGRHKAGEEGEELSCSFDFPQTGENESNKKKLNLTTI